MKVMNCPLNGPRNISEFICAGEVAAAPDSNGCSNEEWAAHVFMRDNRADIVREWWMHAPTSYWFIAERDTRTNTIMRTYPASELAAQEFERAQSAPNVEGPTS